VSRTAAID